MRQWELARERRYGSTLLLFYGRREEGSGNAATAEDNAGSPPNATRMRDYLLIEVAVGDVVTLRKGQPPVGPTNGSSPASALTSASSAPAAAVG